MIIHRIGTLFNFLNISVLVSSFLFFSTYNAAANNSTKLDLAVVIADKGILARSDLSLRNTLAHILRKDGQSVADVDQQEIEDFLGELLSSFEKDAFPNVDRRAPNVQVVKNVPLARLEPARLLDRGDQQYVTPAAVFFRPDLTPKQFEDCGEFRIVYSFNKMISLEKLEDIPEIGYVSRFYLIFETRPRFPFDAANQRSKVDNFTACKNIAKEWASFRVPKSKSLDDAKRRTIALSLNRFFYDTMFEDNSVRYRRAMKMEHLGGNDTDPLGQVRGNFKVVRKDQSGRLRATWELREWRVASKDVSNSNKLTFKPVPLDLSPRSELFRNLVGDDPANMNNDFKSLLKSEVYNTVHSPRIEHIFGTVGCEEFVKTEQEEMSERYLVNALGIKSIPQRYLEFQQIVLPDPLAGLFTEGAPEFSDTQAAAKEYAGCNAPKDHQMNWKHLLRRTQVLSCAGCHQNSLGTHIGKSLKGDKTYRWPPSHRFAFVLEPNQNLSMHDDDRISIAVTGHFMKFRSCVLDALLVPSSAEALIEVSENSFPSLEVERVEFLKNAISSQIELDSSERNSLELDRSILELRELLQSGRGAFVEYRRSH